MIKIIIFADTFKHFANTIEEYHKRLWNEIELIQLKPSKFTQIDKIVDDETNILKEKLKNQKW